MVYTSGTQLLLVAAFVYKTFNSLNADLIVSNLDNIYIYILGLCDNRNSHITIMLLDVTIITIVDP